MVIVEQESCVSENGDPGVHLGFWNSHHLLVCHPKLIDFLKFRDCKNITIFKNTAGAGIPDGIYKSEIGPLKETVRRSFELTF